MKILSHRGYWVENFEKNTLLAFKRSAEKNFGTETDLRDFCGRIKVAHDMAKNDDMHIEAFLEIFKNTNLPLALNIKADGLAQNLKKILQDFNISNYFVFDMSLPDQRSYLNAGMKVFTGMSDLNPIPALMEDSVGVWLDAFNGDWYGPDLVHKIMQKGKQVCIVSPELHKRDYSWTWKMLKEFDLHTANNLMICTDFPEAAKEFFYGDIK